MSQKTYGLKSEHSFTLEALDDPETWVKIKPASFAERKQREMILFGERVWIYREDAPEARVNFTDSQAVEIECFLTFVDSNLLGEKGLLFKKGMAQSAFVAAFGSLPDEVVELWHEEVRKLNPQWAPGGVTKNESDSSAS